MPVMDGYTATPLIKSFCPDIPVIALTAYAQLSARENALQAGCTDLLVKPVRKAQLYEMLDRYLTGKPAPKG